MLSPPPLSHLQVPIATGLSQRSDGDYLFKRRYGGIGEVPSNSRYGGMGEVPSSRRYAGIGEVPSSRYGGIGNVPSKSL